MPTLEKKLAASSLDEVMAMYITYRIWLALLRKCDTDSMILIEGIKSKMIREYSVESFKIYISMRKWTENSEIPSVDGY